MLAYFQDKHRGRDTTLRLPDASGQRYLPHRQAQSPLHAASDNLCYVPLPGEYQYAKTNFADKRFNVDREKPNLFITHPEAQALIPENPGLARGLFGLCRFTSF
jgi:hypothetical protein